MSDNKHVISENKVIEHNEKAFQDTLQLMNHVKRENVDKDIDFFKNNPSWGHMNSLFMEKGREIWVKLKIKDTYLSSLLFSWMFDESNHDGEKGLHAFGSQILEIGQLPDKYTPEEKEAIKTLYKAIFKEE